MSSEHCPGCDGIGVFTVPCETCMGEGPAGSIRKYTRCPDCDGIGQFLYICHVCEGSGLLPKEHLENSAVCEAD